MKNRHVKEDNKKCYKVTFIGWESDCDEELSWESGKIAPYKTKQLSTGRESDGGFKGTKGGPIKNLDSFIVKIDNSLKV